MMQYLVGVNETARFAESMGIATRDYILNQDPGLSLGLGSVPVNLTNMTGAYGVFAQQGVLHPPTSILEIRDRNNRVIYSLRKDGPEQSRPMTQAEAYLTHWILEGNTNPETNVLWGPRAELRDQNGVRRQAGFKTGTTDNFIDVSGFGYVPGSLVTGVWMGNNNREPLSNALGVGLFSADGPLYLWHDFMEIALNRKWDWNGQQPVPQTDFPQPAGVTVETVCKYSGMLPGLCGETREIPFLEGTVPPVDNVHSQGCFDIVQAVAQDRRRPLEWIDSADDWSFRYVNGQTGSVGDATELKENPSYHLQIAPVLGNSGFGSPICGEVIFVPEPDETPDPDDRDDDDDDDDKCKGNGNPHCSAEPTIRGDDDDLGPTGAVPHADFGVVIPTLGLSLAAWLIPLGARAARRRR
jgi:membrane peptidoglycan carboxypeptidase